MSTHSLPGRLTRLTILGNLAGALFAAIVFFSVERIWRAELPRLFPDGDLSAVAGPRLGVRARMVAMFLLVSLVPIAVLSVAALTRAYAMLGADTQAAPRSPAARAR